MSEGLPRCQHGNAVRDWSGAFLFPSCGCIDPFLSEVERRTGASRKEMLYWVDREQHGTASNRSQDWLRSILGAE